jgi:hypothetical protein
MTVTFSGVEIKNASKVRMKPEVASRDTLLQSGKHSVKSNVNYGRSWTYTGLGTKAEVNAVLALIGTKAALVTEEETVSNAYITSWDDLEESDTVGEYFFTVTFTEHQV